MGAAAHLCQHASPSNAFFTGTFTWRMVTSVYTSTQCPVSSLHEQLVSPPTLDSLSLCHSCLFPSVPTAACCPTDVSSVLVSTSASLAVELLTSKLLSISPSFNPPDPQWLTNSLVTSLSSCKPLWILSGSPAAWLLLASCFLPQFLMHGMISGPSRTFRRFRLLCLFRFCPLQLLRQICLKHHPSQRWQIFPISLFKAELAVICVFVSLDAY